MPSPFIEERIDETAPDYLGLDVPVAFRGQPALPTQGSSPSAAPGSPSTPGGEGGPVAQGAPEAPGEAASGGFPNAASIATAFGPQLIDVAGRIFGSADPSFGAIDTPSGQITTSAPDILRDVQFGDQAFDPTLVSEPPVDPVIPSGFDDALGWATLVGSIVAPAISLSGVLGGGDLRDQQGAARQFAGSGLSGLGQTYADAAVSGDPNAIFAALGTRQGGGAIRSELALPSDVIAQLGLPPAQAGRYDWAALTPQQFAAVNARFQADPTLLDSWVVGSGDVPRLPEADALGVADAAAQMARTVLRHSLGIPEPVRPDVAPVVSEFEELARFLETSGGDVAGPDGAPAGSSFSEGGRAFGPTSPLSSNIAKAAQLAAGFAPIPGLTFPLSLSRGVEGGLNFITNNFPNLAAMMGITGVDVGPETPDEGAMFSPTPTPGNTVAFADATSPTGYSFGRPGVGAATGIAPPGSTNFGAPGGAPGAGAPGAPGGVGTGTDASGQEAP
jgi:hypothetical protein